MPLGTTTARMPFTLQLSKPKGVFSWRVCRCLHSDVCIHPVDAHEHRSSAEGSSVQLPTPQPPTAPWRISLLSRYTGCGRWGGPICPACSPCVGVLCIRKGAAFAILQVQAGSVGPDWACLPGTGADSPHRSPRCASSAGALS